MSRYIRAADTIETTFRVGNPSYLNRASMIADIANLIQSWHSSISSSSGDDRDSRLYDLSASICKILLVIDSVWYDSDIQPLDGEVAEFLDVMYTEFDNNPQSIQ
jgi:hypothetical protein